MRPPAATSLTPRVLFLVDGLWVGGTERSLVELVPRLEEAGLATVLASLRHRDEGVEREAVAAGLNVRILDVGSGLVSQVRAVRRLLAAERPHILHASLFRASLVARLAGVGRPVLVVNSLVNTPYSGARLADPALSVPKLRLVQLADALTARLLADHLHAVSESVCRAAVRDLHVPAERITVVPRGRDPERLGTPSPERRRRARRTFGVPDDAEVIVHVGRQDYQKGHDTLLAAMARLAPGHPRLLVLVAGREGNATPRLTAQQQDLQLAERVRWLGHREDLPEVLAAADVFAFPSRFEGFPGAVLEALALGLPVVASDIPPLREIIRPGENGLLTPPDDAGELAAALGRLLTDREVREAMGRRNRQLFEERFTLERSAADLVALYHRLVNPTTRNPA